MKKIIISDNPWQTRIAVTRDEKIQNIYFSSHAIETLERSFFKGIITKVLPGIQTAFVEIGQERAGFLHISEIDRARIQTSRRVFCRGERSGNKKTKKRTTRICRYLKNIKRKRAYFGSSQQRTNL